jgi:predicted alpha/beta superfamily hydrolase
LAGKLMRAIVEVHYPVPASATLTLSGTTPLRWETKLKADSQTAEGARFVIENTRPVDFKVRLDEHWSVGRNLRLEPGADLHCYPNFFSDQPVVDVYPDLVAFKGAPLTFEVFLPPSYAENTFKRYPVIYAQDGQNLFDTPTPTTDVHWHLDTIAQQLMLLGLCEEVIIVGIHHRGVNRILDYTPFADPKHGGGGAGDYADFLMKTLKPLIDRCLRSKPGPNDTAVMGSSLGALFAFYAGRNYPNVFGKVAALSTSLQWDGLRMLRDVKRCTQFAPILLYMDAGTKGDEMQSYDLMQDMVEELLFDGFRLGRDFYALAQVGDDHSEKSWSHRVHYPLSFLFPWLGCADHP